MRIQLPAGLFSSIQESLSVRTQAYERARALGDTFAEVTFLTHAANNYRVLTENQTLLAKLDEAIQLARQMNDNEGVALAENQRVKVLLPLGRLPEAHDLIARVVCDTDGWLEGRMRWYLNEKLALTHILQGQITEGQTTLRAALEFPAAQKEMSVRTRLHTTLAVSLIAEGDVEHAAQLLDKPLVDVPLWTELDRQLILALLALARGQHEQARALARGGSSSPVDRLAQDGVDVIEWSLFNPFC